MLSPSFITTSIAFAFSGNTSNLFISLFIILSGFNESFTYTIENPNIVSFAGGGQSRTKTSQSPVDFIVRSISEPATTTVTIQGNMTGLVKVVTISVLKDDGSSNSPDAPIEDPDWMVQDGGAGGAG